MVDNQYHFTTLDKEYLQPTNVYISQAYWLTLHLVMHNCRAVAIETRKSVRETVVHVGSSRVFLLML